MSVSAEVQRTLVKSPPELWAELSDPQALTRHLGDFGEIKITSVEPETKVEWEAEEASGIVYLTQSGWGTKVTLSVTRNPPAPTEPAEAEAVAAVEPQPAPEPEPEVVTQSPETAAAVETERAVEPEPQPTLEPVAVVEPAPKLGFFSRLFRKRNEKPATVLEQEPEVEREPEPEREVVAMAAPEPIYPGPPRAPVVDLAVELASVEAQMAEETTELLTCVLDRLGAAHHRPFSRG